MSNAQSFITAILKIQNVSSNTYLKKSVTHKYKSF